MLLGAGLYNKTFFSRNPAERRLDAEPELFCPRLAPLALKLQKNPIDFGKLMQLIIPSVVFLISTKCKASITLLKCSFLFITVPHSVTACHPVNLQHPDH